MRTFSDRLRGIHAATIVPMTPGFEVDEAQLASHLISVASTPGINGLLVNGHAGENFVLSLAEKRRVVELARQHAPKDCLIVSGVNHESSLEAAREAAALEQAGADGLLVFPPNSWALGHADDCVIEHHRRIRDATTVPLMLYAAPVGAGAMAYAPPLLTRLVADARFVAVKEGSWEVAAYEQNLRLIRKLRPDFVVLGSGDEHLLTSYIVGSAGSQVSLACVVPELVVGLWSAAEAGDWERARAAHDKLYPLAVAIYRDPPGGRATVRLKACLKLLGRLSCDAARPPQPVATRGELQALEQALRVAGVL
ncbi:MULTISPECIES: dihydrodipicolinate synthase family protein [Bradyrhizobium]|uniref:dihydrodipicolinate synthase family protein n=1 Tax=Bradyrhizobium TaxID=374 RepID=UPI00155E6E36|nr:MULTISPECIES: dihydrodipicolinate synthase family protein [Bradyrhizobium]MDD1518852.1 dihydrodipicolinate synthase family protein [Bradyrhizobium sp. WBAH30]MDD1541150.1 dihydrodipicolinate synthase family protein [Bradyrhizobium sp. WBAH41]MDD1557226.1 dihydrodipicolinate synthase family protein [Bradyrhizobium sp. WBAH23]MDD1563785.1 dihydrodipicolinate synthase family protein [Bradyrhizobium sp. WBAH33]MDD1590046.1 dihydrodipicolinate synthase family protein [Bradyrhizobium sp. WBAH42]